MKTSLQNTLFFLTLLLCPFSMSAQSGDVLFETSYLHEIRINFEEPDFWNIMTQYYNDNSGMNGGGSSVPYLMGTVEIDGNIVDSVGVRQKGFSSYFFANQYKKSLKLDFNEFVPGKRYDGLRKLNLNNGVGDPGLQRDFLCYNMIREAGGIAPRVAHAKVYLNDTYWGIYIMIEQVDQEFLGENFENNNGNLFKNIGWSNFEWQGTNVSAYKESFELKTNEDLDDWTRFIEFVDLLNNSGDIEFEEKIQDYFNVDLYLRTLAIDIMTNNWDSYIDHGRNWYIYQDSSTNAFHWIPWDYNLAMGGSFDDSGDPGSPADDTCPYSVDFLYSREDLTLSFTDETDSLGTSWFWEFGDDSTSVEQNPTHTYLNDNIFQVCLTVELEIGDSLCSKTNCKNVDLTFNPEDCQTIQNGSCPYSANDPIFIQVIAQDPFCCENDWDGLCQSQFDDIQSGGGGGGGGGNPIPLNNFDLLYNSPDKKLIDRILDVPYFREHYLNICCDIIENNFTAERLEPMIDYNADLVREAVYEDGNFIFNSNYFEYDVTNTTGTGGVGIPPLKYFIDKRTESLEDDLNSTGHDCDLQFAQIGWHDLVINEFVADNAEGSEIADPSGAFEDWIELYNNTNEIIELGNLFLSDDIDDLFKWRFDLGEKLEPDSYLIVWADKDLEEEGIHANFKLDKAGESIYLVHEDGTVIDSLTYGEQETNIASARRPNGTGDFLMQGPTFGYNNNLFNPTEAQVSDSGIKLFPNPATSAFFIDLKKDEKINSPTVVIRNYLGQTVFYKEKINEGLNEISVGNFGAGLFTVQFLFDDNSSVSKKIIITGAD